MAVPSVIAVGGCEPSHSPGGIHVMSCSARSSLLYVASESLRGSPVRIICFQGLSVDRAGRALASIATALVQALEVLTHRDGPRHRRRLSR